MKTVLVKFVKHDYTFQITFRTRYSRLDLFLMRDTLTDFAHRLTHHGFIERSAGNLVEIFRNDTNSTVNFVVTRIGTGETHEFYLSELDFLNLVEGLTTKALADTSCVRANKVFLIGHAPTDKKRRRAFVKAIRDHFMWYVGRGSWSVYNDGKLDFFFRETLESGTPGICGGLIYDRYTSRNVYTPHT